MTIDTIIFARNTEEAEQFMSRNCLFSAKIATTHNDIPDDRSCEVILVGGFRKNPAWEVFETKLWRQVNSMLLTVTVEEFPGD